MCGPRCGCEHPRAVGRFGEVGAGVGDEHIDMLLSAWTNVPADEISPFFSRCRTFLLRYGSEVSEAEVKAIRDARRLFFEDRANAFRMKGAIAGVERYRLKQCRLTFVASVECEEIQSQDGRCSEREYQFFHLTMRGSLLCSALTLEKGCAPVNLF